MALKSVSRKSVGSPKRTPRSPKSPKSRKSSKGSPTLPFSISLTLPKPVKETKKLVTPEIHNLQPDAHAQEPREVSGLQLTSEVQGQDERCVDAALRQEHALASRGIVERQAPIKVDKREHLKLATD